MFCSLRTKISRFVARITGRGAESERDDEPIILPEGHNPWQDNLKRLADERAAHEREGLDEIASFVQDLRKAAGAVEPEEIVAKKKRETDGTVTDIKSWWAMSVATYDPLNGKDLDSSDQRKAGRAENRWRQ
ncbi:MAG TPA: hypothetical protein V6C97_22280 [Oculatellaceae cyanobacterium]